MIAGWPDDDDQLYSTKVYCDDHGMDYPDWVYDELLTRGEIRD